MWGSDHPCGEVLMAIEPLYRTMREQIAEHIRGDVLAGALEPGQRLREQVLATRYGVSRGPIRDALLQLTQEGVLEAKPNCGVTVSRPPGASLQPLIVDLRRRIEVFAVERACEGLSEAQVAALAGHVSALGAACQAGDVGATVRHDMAFHRVLVEASGEGVVDLWLPIVSRMLLHYTRHEDLMDSYREHAAILAAIRAGDSEAAVAALDRNIQ